MWGLFIYSITEQRGLVLLILLFAATLVLRYWPWTNTNHVELIYSKPDTASGYIPVLKKSPKPKTRQWRLTRFDINYAKARDFRKMGFSNDFIRQWFQQKQSVGFVKSVDQFRALSLLSDDELDLVTPFLDFSRYTVGQKTNKKKKVKSIVIVDVNLADSIAFKELPGIGKTLSKRLVKFRHALGGFYSINQLNEVYGISDSLLSALKPKLKLTPGVNQVSVNSTDVKRLKQHPYINYTQANALVRYRSMHGRFKELNDIRQIHSLDTAWLSKVAPYLSFD